MTSAGATYPYGKDPHDSNIRIAPTYPTLGDLITAAELFALCVKLSSVEKLLIGGQIPSKENDSSVKVSTSSDNDRERRIASRCARSLPHCPGYADSRRSGTDLRAGTI